MNSLGLKPSEEASLWDALTSTYCPNGFCGAVDSAEEHHDGRGAYWVCACCGEHLTGSGVRE